MIDISRRRLDRVLIDIINNTGAVTFSRDGRPQSVIAGNGYRAMRILSRSIFDDAMNNEGDEFGTELVFVLRRETHLNVNIAIHKDNGEFSQLIMSDDHGFRIYHTVCDIKEIAGIYNVPCRNAFLGGIHEREFYVDLGNALAADLSVTFYEIDLRSGSMLSEQRIDSKVTQEE